MRIRIGYLKYIQYGTIEYVGVSLGEFVVFQKNVLEGEFRLFALTPARFVVEVDVGTLFVGFVDGFGVFVALEPGEVLGVVSPGLSL